jgi:hypothetical protein
MTRWSAVLGHSASVPSSWSGRTIDRIPARAGDARERRVARAVERASQLLPGTPSCLAQATAGQVMLRCRHQAGVVVIGLRRPEDPTAEWDAHAWLLGRSGALAGGPAASGFTATTVFEVPGRLRAVQVDLTPGSPTRTDGASDRPAGGDANGAGG